MVSDLRCIYCNELITPSEALSVQCVENNGIKEFYHMRCYSAYEKGRMMMWEKLQKQFPEIGVIK